MGPDSFDHIETHSADALLPEYSVRIVFQYSASPKAYIFTTLFVKEQLLLNIQLLYSILNYRSTKMQVL